MSVLGLNHELNNGEARTWDRVFIATHLCMKYWPKATCIEMNKNSFIMYPNEDVRWKMLKLNSNIWWPFNSFDILKILSADKLIHNWIAEMYLIWNCSDRKHVLHIIWCIKYSLTEKYHWKHHHKRLQTVCPNNCFHTTRHGIYHSYNGFSETGPEIINRWFARTIYWLWQYTFESLPTVLSSKSDPQSGTLITVENESAVR